VAKDYVDYSLVPLKQYQLIHCNQAAPNTPSSHANINILRDLESFSKAESTLDPADLLLDLGHMTTYDYDQLLAVLNEFKTINEQMMASTLIKLANHYQGQDNKEVR
jgi:hypothetical protein